MKTINQFKVSGLKFKVQNSIVPSASGRTSLFYCFIVSLLVLIFHSSLFTFNCFSQDWLWAKSAGGSDDDFGKSVCTDASGNVYVTGYFGSPIIIFGTTTFTNYYYYYTDLFLVKYDNDGNVLWARTTGRDANDESYGVSTDANGNVFITGKFDSPTLTFGSFTLTNSGSYDIFLVKYDSAGTVLWAKNPTSTGIDEGYSVITDISGNVYVTGIFNPDYAIDVRISNA